MDDLVVATERELELKAQLMGVDDEALQPLDLARRERSVRRVLQRRSSDEGKPPVQTFERADVGTDRFQGARLVDQLDQLDGVDNTLVDADIYPVGRELRCRSGTNSTARWTIDA